MACLNSKNQRKDLSGALLAYSGPGSGSATPHVSLVLTARHSPSGGGRNVMDVIGLTGGTPAEIFKGNNRDAILCKKRQ